MAADSGLALDRDEVVFSAVQAQCSEADAFTLLNTSGGDLLGLVLRLVGEHSAAFRFGESGSVDLKANESRLVPIFFCPTSVQIGALEATCDIVDGTGEVLTSVKLHGLSAVGLEGSREAWLSHIVSTVGLKIDIGWDALTTHVRAERVGDEIAGQTFRKAGAGHVQLEPIARYSPDFLLPFGYYHPGPERPMLHSIGTLARATATRAEHNCLYPRLASGTISFDPGEGPFGLFTASPTHVAYTQDEANSQYEPTHTAHATRIYAAKDRNGQPIENAYLVCFEEAANGDYQDYVFLLRNATPTR